jgi:hypothetical protein
MASSVVRRVLWVAVGAWLASGCGKSSGGSTGSTGSGTSGSSGSSGTTGSTGSAVPGAHARCLAFAGAACQHDVACGWVDPGQVTLCTAAFNCDDVAAEAVNDGEVDAGRVLLDAAAYQACLTDIGAAPCAETGAQARGLSANCQQVGQGTSLAGGSCVVGGDCATPGSTCLRAPASCGALAPGYFCGSDGGVAPQVGAGSPCSGNNQCQPPLLCGGVRGSNTCQPQGDAGAGEPCLTNADCTGNGVCLGVQQDGGGGACQARVGVGSACTFTEADGGLATYRDGGPRLVDGLCNTYEYCDPDSRTCLPQALLGAGCNPDGGAPRCLEGFCAAASGGASTCAYLADGQPCARGADCLSGSCVLQAGALVCAHSCP